MHLALSLVVLFGAVPQDEAPVNPYCPVMSSERSTSAHTIRKYGKTIGFCCRGCLELFAAEPYLYEEALPLRSRERTALERPLATPYTVPLALAVLAAAAGAGWKFQRRGLLKAVAVGSAVASAASILATLVFSRWVRIWGMDGVNVLSILGRDIY